MKKFFFILCLFLLSGCNFFGIFDQNEIIKSPDAPMLIAEIDGDEVLVYIYDDINNRMIKYGWVDLNKFDGWTITNYDWEQFIKKKSGDTP